MKISHNWIKQHLKIDLALEKQLELLTNIGLEVEGTTPFESIKGGLKGVLVGEVISCQPHPNADRLRVTQVNLGGDETVQIVCGASNVAAGQRVPVATIGTKLYDAEGNSFEIKKSKIRGEISHGMICAEDELRLGSSHDGIMILSDTLIPGKPCSEVFKIETDTVIEIGLTPNRSDAMSHMGVARDLKAGCDQIDITSEWKSSNTNNFKITDTSFTVDINVDDIERCPQYYGITLSDIEVRPSPNWLQNRLNAIGITPKNNIVDATNYILHDLGQPLHAFDASKIKGKIHVKTLTSGTKFTTLDGEERILHEDDLMICDNEKPLCIAGIFGGLDSCVSENTTSIFLESAYFDPVSIRKSAKRHSLNTDASFRFERGIDREIGIFALKTAAVLIQEISGGKISSEIQEQTQPLPDKVSLFLKFDKITRVIGKKIPKDTLLKILNSLEIEINSTTNDGFVINVPRYRVDVTREADVIEEILRIYGYNNIESSNILRTVFPDFNLKTPYKTEQIIAQSLVGQGFTEVVNNSLTNPSYANLSKQLESVSKVNILNPLGQDLSQLRSSLLFSMLEVVQFNSNRQQKDLKIYEFGKTYSSHEESYNESKKLGICMTGNKYSEMWNSPTSKISFFDMKSTVINILERLGILSFKENKTTIDLFSEGISLDLNNKSLVDFGIVKKNLTKYFSLDSEIIYADFDWDLIYKYAFKKEIKIEEISKFPKSRRDFSLLVNRDVNFDELEISALKIDRKLLKSVSLFDVYEGEKLPEGKKSYGLSFHFSDPNKTLTDKNIDRIMQKIQKEFEQIFGAVLR
tara:strand:+ start:107 stop:2530 length:2424 start_codon:yes stop_codon:yes gene_type:complete